MSKTGKSGAVPRNYSRGENFLKPGQRLQHITILRSGDVGAFHLKGDHLTSITRFKAPEIIGEEAVGGAVQCPHSIIALSDVQVIEIAGEEIRELIPNLEPMLQLFLKGLTERARASGAMVRELGNQRQQLACSPEQTAKAFGVVLHTARALNLDAPANPGVDQSTSSWAEFKRFAFEVFQEPVLRLEETVRILSKLGYARLEQPRSEELGRLHLLNSLQIENFCDYYRYYYFKGGNAELLKTNAKMTRLTEEFLKFSEAYPVDRSGNVSMPFKATMDALKGALGKTFEADQLSRLEQKGLYMKRTADGSGGTLAFFKADYLQMLLNWRILQEVELWNKNGFVEMSDLEPLREPEPVLPMPPSPADLQGTPDIEAEREYWARLLADWKAPTELGQVPQVRTGVPSPGEVWCATCMSILYAGDKHCRVCGMNL